MSFQCKGHILKLYLDKQGNISKLREHTLFAFILYITFLVQDFLVFILVTVNIYLNTVMLMNRIWHAVSMFCQYVTCNLIRIMLEV